MVNNVQGIEYNIKETAIEKINELLAIFTVRLHFENQI